MKKSMVCFLAVAVAWLFAPPLTAQKQGQPAVVPLPVQETELFAGSGVCARCHEKLFKDGQDVSPVTLWRSTMMANAAKDPLWRAKLASEAAEFAWFEGLPAAIEEKCLSCHAPTLYKQAVFDGVSYAITDLEASPLARDGDTCTICHQILPDNFGEKDSFSGKFMIWPDPEDPVALRTIAGPYEDPFIGPMLGQINYTPVLSYPGPYLWTINDSELCATCHNLFTQYVNKDDELSTDKFPEQTPYYEWLNSSYTEDPDTTCQGCHMPKIDTPMKISTAAQQRTVERSPFWFHEFAGGNQFMSTLLKENIDTLGLNASAAHFDKTIQDAKTMLKEKTLSLNVETIRVPNTLNVDVTLVNRAGHKLPTGIPLRRVWIHLKVTDSQGSVVFESGAWDADSGEILALDPDFEPHYDIIDSADQVQIYEGVMEDDFGEVTRLLLRAKSFIKDNRLPPTGFHKGHALYDQIQIIGAANSDADFNDSASGADTVHYQIDTGSNTGPFTVEVQVCYQSVTPGEVGHLAAYDTTETNYFVNDLYAAPDNMPFIITSHNENVE